MENLFNRALSSSGSIALVVFMLTLLFVGFTSIIIFYHWKKYAMSGVMFAMMETLYLTVVVILLSTAFFSLI